MPNQDSDTAATPIKRYDEYTFFAGSTQTLADRRQSATQVYIGVNTSIFALIGFLLNDAGLEGQLDLAVLPLFAVGILVCVVWDRTITQYRGLINWRFQQLMKMEDEMPGSYRMFNREWLEYFRPAASTKTLAFSGLERWLPHVILGLYVVYGGAFVIGKIFDL